MIHPAILTPEERLLEISDILSTAILRLMKKTEKAHEPSYSLDFREQPSIHGTSKD
jgi:hypothetical protein